VALAGKFALVTGAAHGIGLATAKNLAAAGAVVLAADKDGEMLQRNCGSFAGALFARDIGDEYEELIHDLRALTDTCPLVVHNVGIDSGRAFLDLTPDAVYHTWRANVLGPWEITRQLALDLIQVAGAIVFVSSLHRRRVRMLPDYSTSKAAISMLVLELAWALGPHDIRVNEISPGAIDTWIYRSEDVAEHVRRSASVVPLRRLGTSDDVARAVAFLLDTDEAGYVNGAELRVDGGLDTYNWLHHLYRSASEEKTIRRFGKEADKPESS
jgi:NAD(P)-dependent dehydrogenase (short-subunit alcohol dehydrogenase family)